MIVNRLTIIGVLWHYFLRPLLSSLRLSDANGGSDRGAKGEDDGIWALQLLKGVSMLLGTLLHVANFTGKEIVRSDFVRISA